MQSIHSRTSGFIQDSLIRRNRGVNYYSRIRMSIPPLCLSLYNDAGLARLLFSESKDSSKDCWVCRNVCTRDKSVPIQFAANASSRGRLPYVDAHAR